MAYKNPRDGGCWFCSDDDEDLEELEFSYEFDTYFHRSCCLEAFECGDPEAKTMIEELE